jgi:serine/threonine protein kinase
MLAAIILEEKFKKGTIPKNILIEILLKMSDAIRYLHEEKFMVHRDLHWGNWMILPNNDIKLIDFGLTYEIGKNGWSKDYWMPDPFAPPEL